MNIFNHAKKGTVDFYNLTTLQGVSTEDIIDLILNINNFIKK